MLTTAIESCLQGIAEREELHQVHYLALSQHQHHGFLLDPQYEVYAAREQRGELLYVTLRDAGKLVGYYVGFIGPGLHYKTCLTLITDIFFIHQDYRGRHGGVKLFKAVKVEARRRGAKAIFASHKIAEPEPGRLFALFGFEPVETNYCCWLEG